MDRSGKPSTARDRLSSKWVTWLQSGRGCLEPSGYRLATRSFASTVCSKRETEVRSLHPIMVLILFVAACSSTPQRPAGPSLVDARTQAAPPINGSQAALASGQPVAAAGGQAPAGTAAGSAATGTSANT